MSVTYLNYNANGTEITDEALVINTVGSQQLVHDHIMSIEVWTGEGKTGSQLAASTDYTLGDYDSFYKTYNSITFVTHNGETVYCTYLTKGDKNSADDVNSKADKVASPTAGNFAGLDASGNLIDSTSKASDFATSGHAHSAATTAVAGFMSAVDKTKLDGIAESANNYTHPNHSGDVTSVGDGATTIANDAVTNAKMANMVANSLKGNATADSADPSDISIAANKFPARASTGNLEAKSISDFGLGLVAAADAAAGRSALGALGSANPVVSGYLELSEIATPTAPAADTLRLYAVDHGTDTRLAYRNSSGGERILTNEAGINWTKREADTDLMKWRSVCYGNGLFVAVANAGTGNRVMTSPDGINWTARAADTDSMVWYAVCYGNGLFVAVANAGTGNRVMTSPDGINWTKRAADTDSMGWVSVCYGNGLFVAVAFDGTGNRVMTSPDGINWTKRTADTDSMGWVSVCYGNGLFVAVANAGTGNRVMTSGSLDSVSTSDVHRFHGNQSIVSGYLELNEITEPDAGAADTARLFLKDNGSGKTQLCVRFSSGATQVIATQP
jgi:hypothetical protein